MRPVSAAFLATLPGSHNIAARARIVTPGQTGTQPIGLFLPTDDPTANPQTWGQVLLEGGNVNIDMTADIKSTMDIQAMYPWPQDAFDPGTPYGQEIYVEAGVEYGSGTKEYVGLGYFRLEDLQQDDVPDGSIAMQGSDRWAAVRDSRNVTPVTFGASSSVGATIDAVMGVVLPGFVSVYDFDAYGTPLGADHVLDTDRLKFVTDILDSYGKYGVFDYAGKFQVKSIPDVTTQKPVYEIRHGYLGMLVQMSRKITRDGVYNMAVARSQPIGDAAPLQGIATDNDPTSPTYINGGFGVVPEFMESAFLTTQAQCDAAAAAMIRRVTGLPYTVNMGFVPNYALEGYDVVNVSYSDSFNFETHVLDKISYGLGVGDNMSAATRKQFLRG